MPCAALHAQERAMTSAKKYRTHADELLKLARTTVNSEDRACLVAVAQEWVKFAERLEDQEGRETQREGTKDRRRIYWAFCCG